MNSNQNLKIHMLINVMYLIWIKLLDVCSKVKKDIGDPNIFIHNAVAGVADGGLAGSFLSDNPERLDRNFKVNTKSLLYFARELAQI